MPKRVVLLDSRHRDVVKYPNPNNYVFEFGDMLRNVESVELVYAVIYKFGTENVINLFIDELPNRILSNAQAVTNAFTQLPMVNYINEYTGGVTSFSSVKRFRSPLEKLSKMTIRFTDTSGVPYKMLDHILRFEIRTSERLGAADSRYLENLVEPYGPGRALLGLGDAFTKVDLQHAYKHKKAIYVLEQRSDKELQLLNQVFANLMQGFT